MRWIKLHTGIHRNPKVRRAGRDARDLYILLLCVNGEHEFNGVIPADYADPAHLAVDLGVTVETACNAYETARNAGLFHVDEAGNTVIPGYDDEWRGGKDVSTDRVRRHRAKQRNQPNETDETVSRNAVTEVERCNALRGEERRVEERRKKSVQASPEPSPGAKAVAAYLLEAIRSHAPAHKGNAAKWAVDVDLAIRVDGATEDRLRRVIDFAHRSREVFWRGNLLSGSKLRQHLGRLEIQAAQQTLGARDVRVGAVMVTGAEKYAGGEVKI